MNIEIVRKPRFRPPQVKLRQIALCRYHEWWTISYQEYNQLSVQSFSTGMFYYNIITLSKLLRKHSSNFLSKVHSFRYLYIIGFRNFAVSVTDEATPRQAPKTHKNNNVKS